MDPTWRTPSPALRPRRHGAGPRVVGLGLLIGVAACDDVEDVPVEAAATVVDARAVVPGDGLPGSVDPLPANNNLDVVEHDGRVFLAFRTAPNHFASAQARMEVVSSEDEVTWRREGTFSLGTDLREPQLVSTADGLHLYFAQLGTNPVDFEPGGSWRATYEGPGAWSEPERVLPDGMIPWRIKRLDGRWSLFGYVGGENVYELDGDPITIHWLAGDDGLTWDAAIPGQEIVLTGGGSETDAVLLDDGSLVAVVRNEAGDEDGYGSKVCTAPADDLGTWTCDADPRKYDSPLMFRAVDRVWLVARRNVTEDGHYDLGRDDLDARDRYFTYQGAYWNTPKRCAVWTVDPATRTVTWVADLPSRGDTCFPEALEPTPDGRVVLYNYTSPPDGPDLSWIEGQTGPTEIWRVEVQLQ